MKMATNSKLISILKLANQLYTVGKISPNLDYCISIAVDHKIGNKVISNYCSELGITKKDYIEFIKNEYKKIYKNI